MKKLMLALAAVSMVSSTAFAQVTEVKDFVDIEITGSISDAPCKIIANGGTSKIDFKRLHLDTFTGIGSTSAEEQAVIQFVGCKLDVAGDTYSKITLNTHNGIKAPGNDQLWSAGPGVTGVGIELKLQDKILPPSGLAAPVEVAAAENAQVVLKARVMQTTDTVTVGDIAQNVRLDVVYK